MTEQKRDPISIHLVINRVFINHPEMTKEDMNASYPDEFCIFVDGQLRVTIRRSDFKCLEDFLSSFASVIDKIDTELEDDDTIIMSFVNEPRTVKEN